MYSIACVQQEWHDSFASAPRSMLAAGKSVPMITKDNVQRTRRPSLRLDMHPEEDVWMSQMGHLKQWVPDVGVCRVAVSSTVGEAALVENLKMLFVFSKLRTLQLRLDGSAQCITASVLASVGELLSLTSVALLGGRLAPDADVGSLTSLRGLQELRLLPATGTGISDPQAAQVAQLTGLRSLALRGHPRRLTDQGVCALGSLSRLTSLSVCPLGRSVTRAGLTALAAPPDLKELRLGVTDSRQALLLSSAVKDHCPASVSLAVVDPSRRLSGVDVLSSVGWCLGNALTRLRLGPIAVPNPGDMMKLLAALPNMQELHLQVHPLVAGDRPVLELTNLSELREMRSFELVVSSDMVVPLDVRVVSVLAVSWPKLHSLALSLAGKPELQPEALSLLDNFSALTHLALYTPIDTLPANSEPPSPAAHSSPKHGSESGSLTHSWSALSLLHNLGIGGSQGPLNDEAAASEPDTPGGSLSRCASISRALSRRSVSDDPFTLAALEQGAPDEAAPTDAAPPFVAHPGSTPAAAKARRYLSCGLPPGLFGSGGSGDLPPGRAPLVGGPSADAPAAGTKGATPAALQSASSLGRPPRNHSSGSLSSGGGAAAVRAPSGAVRASPAAPPGLAASPQAEAAVAGLLGRRLAVMRASHTPPERSLLYMSYLPPSLTSLTLERVHLVLQAPAPALSTPPPSPADAFSAAWWAHSLGLAVGGGATPASGAGGRAAVRTVSLPRLERVELEDCVLEDFNLHYLATAGALPELKSLTLTCVEGLTDAGLSVLTALSALTELCVDATNSTLPAHLPTTELAAHAAATSAPGADAAVGSPAAGGLDSQPAAEDASSRLDNAAAAAAAAAAAESTASSDGGASTAAPPSAAAVRGHLTAGAAFEVMGCLRKLRRLEWRSAEPLSQPILEAAAPHLYALGSLRSAVLDTPCVHGTPSPDAWVHALRGKLPLCHVTWGAGEAALPDVWDDLTDSVVPADSEVAPVLQGQ